MIMMSLRRRILGVPFRQTYILYPHTKVARAAPPFFSSLHLHRSLIHLHWHLKMKNDFKGTQAQAPLRKKREISWDST